METLNIAQLRIDYDNGTLICRDTIRRMIEALEADADSNAELDCVKATWPTAEQMTNQLYQLGWRATADAQFENINKFWSDFTERRYAPPHSKAHPVAYFNPNERFASKAFIWHDLPNFPDHKIPVFISAEDAALAATMKCAEARANEIIRAAKVELLALAERISS